MHCDILASLKLEQVMHTEAGKAVLNRQQALAAADALIIRVEAEKRRRLERRTSRWTVLYPALKGVPLEEREALHRAALQAPRTRQLVIGTASVILLALAALYAADPGGEVPAPFAIIVAAMAVLTLVRFLCVRAFLKREAARRHPVIAAD